MRPIHYAESQVPPYQLPDPLRLADGTPVSTPTDWYARRRPELLGLFADHIYGRTPDLTPATHVCLHEQTAVGTHGDATRTQVTIEWEQNGAACHVDLLIYLPAATRPAPCFMGLNFHGNHTTQDDIAIRLPTASWPEDDAGASHRRHMAEESRGSQRSRWPLAQILGRGYGLITAYCGDLTPDVPDGLAHGVGQLPTAHPWQERPGNGWGAVGRWAWGLSRILDYCAVDPAIDETRVALMGHSRLGKTALWAGAQDARFALVISNNSGCAGAALSRRCFGETVAAITTRFPHWFCPTFHTYADREAALPVDQHQLLSLIAPRPLYVASATDDLWADPRGEFLGLQAASSVYRLLGVAMPELDAMPPANARITGAVGYHLRQGGHDITSADWAHYLDFADRHLAG